jgi:hypothetical protein
MDNSICKFSSRSIGVSPWGISFSTGSAAHEKIVYLKHGDLLKQLDPKQGILLFAAFTTSTAPCSIKYVLECAVHNPGLLGVAEHGVALPGAGDPIHHDGALAADPHALDLGPAQTFNQIEAKIMSK